MRRGRGREIRERMIKLLQNQINQIFPSMTTWFSVTWGERVQILEGRGCQLWVVAPVLTERTCLSQFDEKAPAGGKLLSVAAVSIGEAGKQQKGFGHIC